MLERLDKKQKIIIAIAAIAVLFVMLIIIIAISTGRSKKSNTKIEEIYLKATLVDEDKLKFEVGAQKNKKTNFLIEKSDTLEFKQKEEIEGSKNESQIIIDTEEIEETTYYRVKLENIESKEVIYSNVISITKNEEEDEENEDKENEEENIDEELIEIEERSDEKKTSKSKKTEKSDSTSTSQSKDKKSESSYSQSQKTNSRSSNIESSSYGSKEKSNSNNKTYNEEENEENTEEYYSDEEIENEEDDDENSEEEKSKNSLKSKTTSSSKKKNKKAKIEIKYEEKIIEVKDIKISATNVELDMSRKNKRELKVTINPENATEQEVIWETEDEKIVKVDENGEITGVSNGETNIIARVGEKEAKCKVKVITTATGIKLDKQKVTLDITTNKQMQITAKAVPQTATNSKITWTSEDVKIAKVSAEGVITGISNGKTKIIAKIGTITKECEVIVETSPEKIKLNKKNIELDLNQNNQTKIEAKIVPNTSSYTKINWSSSNKKVAIVDQTGKVTAKGEGVATITAKIDGQTKIKAKTVISVNSSVSSIELSKKNIEFNLFTYTETKISARLKNGETYKEVKWTSSNKSVAKVVGEGLTATVTGIKAGEAIITVKIDGKTSVCQVTVEKGKLVLTKSNNDILEIGGNNKTNIIINNQNNLKNIRYISSNPNVAVVDSTGVVTGKNAGTATIKVESDEGIGTSQVVVKRNEKKELGKKIAEYAKQFLGSQYIFGAARPGAFDCSGLVLYVYKQFGYTLPHKASIQAKYGKEVNVSELQEGDLLFFETQGPDVGISHVGIYVGNGKMVHASSPKVGVILSSINTRKIAIAKRII